MDKSHIPIRSKLRLNLKQISTIYDPTNKIQIEKANKKRKHPNQKEKSHGVIDHI